MDKPLPIDLDSDKFKDCFAAAVPCVDGGQKFLDFYHDHFFKEVYRNTNANNAVFFYAGYLYAKSIAEQEAK